ncbi:uncharacterized protein LOC117345394 [Pecten maximus]|uniref:uncharacterized protein LOC117345394 n=1 Tax=Pecten maximus TaxID=6579 RepID=UPI0014589141|nr:uncharacterized protein LOC117345394 [Pecten maximus]
MKTYGIVTAILLGILCVIHCNALNDTGEILDMKPSPTVNVTTRSQKNQILLKLIRSMLPGEFNYTRRRGAWNDMERSISNGPRQKHIPSKKAYHGTSRTERAAAYSHTKYVKRIIDDQSTTCARTTCYNGTQIKPCEVNFTADICEPCPPGTYMYDITRSMETVLKCIPKHPCHHWPGTVHANEFYVCAGDYKMFCRCNTEDNICGSDPCNCKKMRCRLGETLLQNCTCLAESSPVTTVKTTRTTSLGHETVPAVPPSPGPGLPPTTNADTDTPPIAITSTIQTLLTDPRMKNADGGINWRSVGTAVGIVIGILIIALICVFVIYRCRRRTQPFENQPFSSQLDTAIDQNK